MKFYKCTETGKVWAFEDDTHVENGIMTTADGMELDVPHTLAPYTPEPTEEDHRSVWYRNNREVLQELHAIDLMSIRPLREGNTERLAELNAQAAKLRGRFNS